MVRTLPPTPPKCLSSKGFTLVELMVTLLVSFFILAAIHQAYKSQQKSQTVLSQRIEMQQQLRALMTFLTSEIRLAGLDPLEADSVGIESISAGGVEFTMDRDGDGLVTGNNENLEYGFKAADDGDSDGEADAGAASFCRRRNNVDATEAGFETLADNIVAVEFLSVLEDTSDNNQYDPETTLSPSTEQLDDIRSVTISVLIRANYEDTSFDNTGTYTTASGAIWGPYDDHYRRMLLTSNVKLRNIGL